MATSYQVYYSYSALGEYRREGDPVTTTSFISDDLWESGLFFFKVIAVNAAGESPFSDFASVTTFSSTGSAGMPWGTYSPVALASANGWRNYTLSPAYDEHWFKVTTTEANYSHAVVAARDRQNIGGGKTADVILEAYGSVDGTFQLYVDAGAGTNTTASAEYITFSSPGTLYIRVVAKNDSNDNAGTYSIYFNTAAR
jgi:hypothetical protein